MSPISPLFVLLPLFNFALMILAVVYLLYGILAFRKYLKSDRLPPKNDKPEEW